MQLKTIASLSAEQCCGCSACHDKCPVNAITMSEDNNGNRRPFIDNEKCITCSLCVKVCPQFNQKDTILGEKVSYVGFYKSKEVEFKSSSGGIFALIASYIINERQGVVYGSTIIYENEILQCKHIRIDNIDDLYLLQGSKYVQSRTDGIFKRVKEDLAIGRVVLFSGTSCQIASLQRYIGDNERLFTVDLVCHGVPKDSIFRDYIKFYENKYKCRISNISFRSKGLRHLGKETTYLITLNLLFPNKQSVIKISRNKSAYFSLFMNRAGYRNSCYHCSYASLNKPGDITLGDFLPRKNEIIKYGFSLQAHYSSIIINSEKGNNLWNVIAKDAVYVKIPIQEMLSHHSNLVSPSTITEQGKRLYSIYRKDGFKSLQNYVMKQYIITESKIFIKYVICKFFRKLIDFYEKSSFKIS